MTTKVCTKCGEEKPLSEFYKNPKTKDGRQGSCKECSKDYNKQYRAENREAVLAYDRKRYRDNPEKRKLSKLNSVYGLSIEQFHAMWDAQGGKCGICSTTLCLDSGKFAIDHNHDTGEVRGLLCSPCNLGLGLFKDNPKITAAATTYLTERGHYARS